jgi:putative ABC transport system permease protein
MSYAISTLWHDRQRYLPGVLAVGFSALLIALQCGLLMGMFSVSSMPVDRGSANVWMGAAQCRSGRSGSSHSRRVHRPHGSTARD